MRDNIVRILAAIAALSEDERAILFERLAGEVGFPLASQTALHLHFVSDEFEGPADYAIIFDDDIPSGLGKVRAVISY